MTTAPTAVCPCCHGAGTLARQLTASDLRALRESYGITRRDLATEMRYAPNTITGVECGLDRLTVTFRTAYLAAVGRITEKANAEQKEMER